MIDCASFWAWSVECECNEVVHAQVLPFVHNDNVAQSIRLLFLWRPPVVANVSSLLYVSETGDSQITLMPGNVFPFAMNVRNSHVCGRVQAVLVVCMRGAWSLAIHTSSAQEGRSSG